MKTKSISQVISCVFSPERPFCHKDLPEGDQPLADTKAQRSFPEKAIDPLASHVLTTPFCTILMILGIGMMSVFANGPLSTEMTDRMELASFETATGGAYLVFAGKHGGNISRTELKGQTELQVDGCARGSIIFAFTLEVNRKGKVTRFSAKSNVLTAEMIIALNELETGDSFNFLTTKAYLPGGKDEVDVHSQKFVIVASHT